MTTPASTKNILIASAITLLVAAVILVTTILPAEFNVDPLGTGKLLGIAGMSEEQTVGALNMQTIPYASDTFTITLAAFESVEYKYRLEAGATMIFAWQANDTLDFDLHAEQDGRDPAEYSPSFDQRQSKSERGSYTAPFSGIHGWYWENRSLNDVTLTLDTTGFFSAATEFRQNYKNEKQF